MNDEQKAGVLQNAGTEKQRFLELCFSENVSALSLLSDSVFNEVRWLSVSFGMRLEVNQCIADPYLSPTIELLVLFVSFFSIYEKQ